MILPWGLLVYSRHFTILNFCTHFPSPLVSFIAYRWLILTSNVVKMCSHTAVSSQSPLLNTSFAGGPESRTINVWYLVNLDSSSVLCKVYSLTFDKKDYACGHTKGGLNIAFSKFIMILQLDDYVYYLLFVSWSLFYFLMGEVQCTHKSQQLMYDI